MTCAIVEFLMSADLTTRGQLVNDVTEESDFKKLDVKWLSKQSHCLELKAKNSLPALIEMTQGSPNFGKAEF